MKTRINSRLIRNTLIAVTALSLPMFATASSNISVAFDKSELDSVNGQLRVYEKMKDASRELCGSPYAQVTGAAVKSINNDECFNGTLYQVVACRTLFAFCYGQWVDSSRIHPLPGSAQDETERSFGLLLFRY